MDSYFAVSAPGLEAFTSAELHLLGLKPKEISQRASGSPAPGGGGGEEGGGVSFEGGLAELYKANLYLRSASRVLVRVGDFYAAAFPELRKKTARLPWNRYLRPGQPVLLHVTCHKSKLYHSDAVAERVLQAIGDALGRPSPLAKAEEENADAQLIIVRLIHDHCTISVDTSGGLLHRRGYRLATAKAPLRETLAAGMLLAAGWDARSPLLDPFCGSGTIPIEAALMARGLPPGRTRSFAFMHWPGYDPKRWQDLLDGIQPRPAAECPPIQASDRDTGAIRIAQANAERAGVVDAIQFGNFAVSNIQPPPGLGWVVTNPPYGVRVSANKDLRNLYAQLGNVLRAHCRGWQVGVLCNDLALLGQMKLKLDTSLTLINGGISVRLARGRVE